MAPIWYYYWAMRWTYTKFVMCKRSSVKGILWLGKGFESVTATTSKITCPSSFFYLLLNYVTWLYGLSNRVKSGYGVSIAQSRFNVSILECCSRKHVTLSGKCFSILRWITWRVSGRIKVIQNTHFIFLKLHSEVPTTSSPRYFLASCLLLSSPWVASIICRKYRSYSPNHRDNE